jgi:hypothetical protein
MTLFPLDPPLERQPYEGDLDPDPVSESQARASRDGREFDVEAFEYLERAGAQVIQKHFRVDGYPLDALVEGGNGARFYIDAHGTPDRTSRPQAGMRRQDTMLKFGCKAYHWKAQDLVPRLILVTSHMPTAKMASARTLQDLGRANALWDAVQVTGDLQGFHRLQKYFTSEPPCEQPLPAPWRDGQMQLRGVGRPEAY